MANIVDMFKIWSESPHTTALQGLLDPNPGYAQQYLDPMSPNNPFELQMRAMGLLGGMQQASNQAVQPMVDPTQYMQQAPMPPPKPRGSGAGFSGGGKMRQLEGPDGNIIWVNSNNVPAGAGGPGMPWQTPWL